ncbi:hypothetical protein BV898_11884 [Hypsibius exemplaris]|uniref:DDE-1 domain-containing protein n=1 Tax=Hypsibius exemplaris TaxID=2072580 RepID=A0A1W0WFD2_HYPEX|nr:hypothetical protein BV898_11884 [Hypsibius exemplaris]
MSTKKELTLVQKVQLLKDIGHMKENAAAVKPKTWMTTAICTEWLKNFNAQMKFQNRWIALLFDNAPSHRKNLKLSNLELIYLSLNLTSEVQPLDQGILRTTKILYRK